MCHAPPADFPFFTKVVIINFKLYSWNNSHSDKYFVPILSNVEGNRNGNPGKTFQGRPHIDSLNNFLNFQVEFYYTASVIKDIRFSSNTGDKTAI